MFFRCENSMRSVSSMFHPAKWCFADWFFGALDLEDLRVGPKQKPRKQKKNKKPPIVIAESQKSPWDSFMLFVTKIPLAMSRKISRAPLRFVVWLGQKVVLRSCRGTRNPKCLARWMPFCRPVTGTEHPKRNLKTEKTEKPFPKKTSNCGDFLLKKTILEMVFNKNWGWWY